MTAMLQPPSMRVAEQSSHHGDDDGEDGEKYECESGISMAPPALLSYPGSDGFTALRPASEESRRGSIVNH